MTNDEKKDKVYAATLRKLLELKWNDLNNKVDDEESIAMKIIINIALAAILKPNHGKIGLVKIQLYRMYRDFKKAKKPTNFNSRGSADHL